MSKSLRNVLLALVLMIIVGSIYLLERPQQVEMESGEMMDMGPISDEDSVIEVGEMTPDFRLVDYDGNVHQLSDYYGQPIVVNFWATWCPFCIDEMPDFQVVFEELGGSENLNIIAVNRAENEAEAKEYTDAMNLTYTILLNPTESVAEAYELIAMPSTYFIDESGTLAEIHRGPLTADELRTKLESNFGLMTESISKKTEIAQDDDEDTENDPFTSSRPISVTDGVKHSVDLDDILGGGPPMDGIPSIDDPEFVSVEEADEFLDDDKLGIGVSFDGIDRFYSFQILVWHEIVNDVIGSQPALITYCPLCGTGVVYEPIVKGEVVEFGTSGKLWNSNLVMYDRLTESYWSQVLGEAIVGEMTGTILNRIPYVNMLWGDWKELYPDGEVLSDNTGYFRDYTSDPYGGYYTDDAVWFDLDYEDDRYHSKSITWGIEINGTHKAYILDELESGPKNFNDTVGGVEISVIFDSDIDTVYFENAETGEEIVPVYGFWFSWFSVHPDTEVYTP